MSSPPHQAWLTANRAASGRTRAVLRRIRFTLDDATAMDYAVNVEGVSMLQAARLWMEQHPDQVRAWLN